MILVGASSQIGKIEHGQTIQISEDEVLGYKDLPAEAYEFSALRLGTTYELMDFLARAQVVAAARMAEEHAVVKIFVHRRKHERREQNRGVHRCTRTCIIYKILIITKVNYKVLEMHH